MQTHAPLAPAVSTTPAQTQAPAETPQGDSTSNEIRDFPQLD
jgi:hypothetical protein